MKLLIVGSIAIDTIETADTKKTNIIGGSANYSAAAAVHFVQPLICGIVGNDYPEKWLENLKSHGVDISGIEITNGKSFYWEGRYNSDFSERISIETKLGVFENFSPLLPAHYRTARFVFLGNIKPEIQNLVLNQLHNPEFVAIDTMNCWIEECRNEFLELIKRVDCLFINEEELKILTGCKSYLKGLEKLKETGAKIVVAKFGKWGSMLMHNDTFFYSPAFPVNEVVDTTGAGDSFAGAFIGCLASYGYKTVRDFKRALLYGTAVASFAVENFEPYHLLTLPKDSIIERFIFLKNLINY